MAETLQVFEAEVQEALDEYLKAQGLWLKRFPHIYYLVDHEGVILSYGLQSSFLDVQSDSMLKHKIANVPVNRGLIAVLKGLVRETDRATIVSGSWIDAVSTDRFSSLPEVFKYSMDWAHKTLERIDPDMRFLDNLTEEGSLLVFVNDGNRKATLPGFTRYLQRSQYGRFDTLYGLHHQVPCYRSDEANSYVRQLIPTINKLKTAQPEPLLAFLS